MATIPPDWSEQLDRISEAIAPMIVAIGGYRLAIAKAKALQKPDELLQTLAQAYEELAGQTETAMEFIRSIVELTGKNIDHVDELIQHEKFIAATAGGTVEMLNSSLQSGMTLFAGLENLMLRVQALEDANKGRTSSKISND